MSAQSNSKGGGKGEVVLTEEDRQALIAERADLERRLQAKQSQILDLRRGDPRSTDPGSCLELDELVAEQIRLGVKIREISSYLRQARVVSKEGCGSRQVVVGSEVTVAFLTGQRAGKKVSYTITHNGNPRTGTLSASAPLPKALLGHSLGDEVEFRTESGIAHRVKVLTVR